MAACRIETWPSGCGPQDVFEKARLGLRADEGLVLGGQVLVLKELG